MQTDAGERTPPPRRRNLIENLASLLGGQIVAKATTFIALYFLARYLGNELFGRYAVALAIPAALDVVSDLGLSWATVREGAGRPDVLTRDVADIVPLKIALAVLMVVLSYLTAMILGLPEEVVTATVFLAIARALDSLTQIARSVFEAFERMEFEAISAILDATSRLAFTLYALLSGFGLVGLAKALAVSGVVVLAATGVLVRHRFLRRIPRPRPARWGALLLAGTPFAVLAFFEVISFRIQTVLTSQLAGDAAAGMFGAAIRIVEATVIFPGMLGVALFPIASRHAAGPSPARLTELWLGVGKAALIVAVGGGLLLAGIAPILVPVMFGDDFRPAIGVTQILCLAMPAVFMKLMASRFLLALRSPWRLTVVQMIAPAMTVGLGLALIPRMSQIGAALALVSAEASAAIAGLLLLQSIPHLRTAEILRPFLAALPAVATLAALLVVGQPLIAATVSGAIFALGLRISGAFSVREVTYLREAVPWLSPLGPLIVGASATDGEK